MTNNHHPEHPGKPGVSPDSEPSGYQGVARVWSNTEEEDDEIARIMQQTATDEVQPNIPTSDWGHSRNHSPARREQSFADTPRVWSDQWHQHVDASDTLGVLMEALR